MLPPLSRNTACARVQVHLKGPGAGRESAVRALQAAGHRGEDDPRHHSDPAQRLPSAQASQSVIFAIDEYGRGVKKP